MTFLQDHQSSHHSTTSSRLEDEDKSRHSESAVDSSNITTSNPDGTGGGDTSSSGNSFERKVVGKENRAVLQSKAMVLLVICVVAAAFATATYFFTKNGETVHFEAKFEDYADEVIHGVHYEADSVFSVVSIVASTLTSDTLTSGAKWPFFTMPHFEIMGRESNGLSRVLQLTVVPLVSKENKALWEAFSVQNQTWIQEGVDTASALNLLEDDNNEHYDTIVPITDFIYRHESDLDGPKMAQNDPGLAFGSGQYGPIWQQAPAPHDPKIINFDLLSHSVFSRVYHAMWETQAPVMSEVMELSFLYGGAVEDDAEHPHSALMQPIYPTFALQEERNQDDIVGFILAVVPWDTIFENLLPGDAKGVMVVLQDSCGNVLTYLINGPEAVFVGQGDHHDPGYTHLGVHSEFSPQEKGVSSNTEHCTYSFTVYPTAELQQVYTSTSPVVFSVVVVLVFLLTAFVFIMYDVMVQRRQDKIMATAKRTNAIVSTFFPSNVRDRILKEAQDQVDNENKQKGKKFAFGNAPKSQLKSFLHEGDEKEGNDDIGYQSQPIADLFPQTTVMFADLVGFTAWSSVREPTQVFILLETLFREFDKIAKRRRIFKVETVGDCYVAVSGLPDPRPDHAVAMARFARDCVWSANEITKKLEQSLGPDTGDLCMRIGLHSGPVTAGVLRGERSRFQLFGDTMNTTARIESTGEGNRIHLSQDTADQLIAANKSHWIKAREDQVSAKGKGLMSTYWLNTKFKPGAASSGGVSSERHTIDFGSASGADGDFADITKVDKNAQEAKVSAFNSKIERLVNWNVDVMLRTLKLIVAQRQAHPSNDDGRVACNSLMMTSPAKQGKTVIDEVQEIIHLPEFDASAAQNQPDPDSIKLDGEVMSQLRQYVQIIAAMYQNNPFHNFEHASHVTMSVSKLLNRIVAPSSLDDKTLQEDNVHNKLHDHTYGITSDPLTQFACLFSALIHDVDHCGVPNAQLVKENSYLASVYKNQSILEQNSVDVAWNLLMTDSFNMLRNALCPTQKDMTHFRSLVVNSVMATDIVDKDLKTLRNARWEKAFSSEGSSTMIGYPENSKDAIDRKATIVIEHLIQASDVSHTMQHWHVYRRWNERLFEEMYRAYKLGRSDKDPSESWYQGEIGFFQFYIIPLARKLKDCGVFGVSSDEYLNYAEKNLKEWEREGQEVTATMVEKFRDVDFVKEVEEAQVAKLLSNAHSIPYIKEASNTVENDSSTLISV